MQNASFAQIELGTIVCKHCLSVIGTVDSEKVQLYYSDCRGQECIESRLKIDRKSDAALNFKGRDDD